jgi:hypothetical protein
VESNSSTNVLIRELLTAGSSTSATNPRGEAEASFEIRPDAEGPEAAAGCGDLVQ